jgi:hypothetical protein
MRYDQAGFSRGWCASIPEADALAQSGDRSGAYAWLEV